MRPSGSKSSESKEPQGIRVVIASDIRLYRDGLAEVLGSRSFIDIIGTTKDAEDLASRVATLQPEVLLLDMSMRDSFLAIRAIQAREPQVKIVALSLPETEPEVIACAEAGIAGYVARDGSLNDLTAVIEASARGEMICSPRVAASLLRRVRDLASQPSALTARSRLTSREREVGDLIAHGYSNKEIAQQLVIELATVKNHVHNILEKLDVSRRAQIADQLREEATTDVLMDDARI